MTSAARRILAFPKVRILLYHSIGLYPDDPYSVTPDVLASHVAILRTHNITILSLRTVLSGWPSRSSGVIFTFDDALRDFSANALPILTEYRVPASLYVPTGMVGLMSDWSWRDKNRPVMTWDELLACRASGIELESHTVNHPDLSRASEPEIVSELERSRDELRRLTGEEPLSIAYPYGHLNPLVKTVTARYYRAGLAVGGLWGLSSATDMFEVPRYMIKGDTTDRDVLAIASGRWDVRRAAEGVLDLVRKRRGQRP